MPIDLISAFELEPPRLDFVWPGFLAGTVGALVAPGATGKSFFGLQAAMSVAGEGGGCDLLGLSPAQSGRVAYIAGEDPEPALIRRVHSIGGLLAPVARRAIAGNLLLEPILGRRLNVMDDRHLSRLVDYCGDCRLVVLDTLSRIHQLDENSNGEMSHLIGTLEYLAATTGAAVLFLHHVSKGSARDGQADQQQAARGASALVDNARWCSFVARMTEDESSRLSEAGRGVPIGDRRAAFVRFGVSKQNYDVMPIDRWYRRVEGGALEPVELTSVSAAKSRSAGWRDEV